MEADQKIARPDAKEWAVMGGIWRIKYLGKARSVAETRDKNRRGETGELRKGKGKGKGKGKKGQADIIMDYDDDDGGGTWYYKL